MQSLADRKDIRSNAVTWVQRDKKNWAKFKDCFFFLQREEGWWQTNNSECTMYNIQIAVNLTSQAGKGQRIGYAGGGSHPGGEGVGSKSRKKVFSGVFWHSWVFLWKAWKAKHCQHLGDQLTTG